MLTKKQLRSATRTLIGVSAAVLCNVSLAIGPGLPPPPPSPGQVGSAINQGAQNAANAASDAASSAAQLSISNIRFHHGGTTIYTNSQGVLFVRGSNVGAPGVSVSGQGISSSPPRLDLDPSCAPPNCRAFDVRTQNSTGTRNFTLRSPTGQTASSQYTIVAAPAPTPAAGTTTSTTRPRTRASTLPTAIACTAEARQAGRCGASSAGTVSR